MGKHIRKILILLLIIGSSSCADVDYVQYLNFFYINQSGYDFEKIEIFRGNKNETYQLNNTDTLKIFTTDDGNEIVMMHADSVNIFYNGMVKKYVHYDYDLSSPLSLKGYVEHRTGKHDNYHNYFYVFSKEEFE